MGRRRRACALPHAPASELARWWRPVRAGRRLARYRLCHTQRVRNWAAAESGARAAVALAAGRASASASSLYFAAEREPAWWAAVPLAAIAAHRGRHLRCGAGRRLSARARFCRRCSAGFAVATMQSRADRASGAALSAWTASRLRALSRCARSASTVRPHRACASQRIEGSRIVEQAAARAAVGAQAARRRRSAPSSTLKAQLRRRCSRCGRAATTSRATFISSASARPASCSARSRPTAPPAAPGLWLRYAAFVEGVREAIDERIRARFARRPRRRSRRR